MSEKYGRYVVVKLLGQGGMGRVYLARDPVLQRKVALKVITLDINLPPPTRKEYLNRFALEARASAQLSHQSIVHVYDAGQQQGTPWIAFQYVEGDSLESLLAHRKRLQPAAAVRLTADIASALDHAHRHGIIHRDIKPGNILIESGSGIGKLTDFGIAKAPGATLTREGMIVGSPGYMSPEQIDGVPLDPRSDLFCLGVVLYQMLSGKHPFLRDNIRATLFATMNAQYAPLGQQVRGLPAALEQMVAACLAPKRDERIATAAGLLERLRSIDGSIPRAAVHLSAMPNDASSRQAENPVAPPTSNPFVKAITRRPVKIPAKQMMEGIRTMGLRIASDTRLAAGGRMLGDGVRAASRMAVDGGVKTCTMVATQVMRRPKRNIPVVLAVVLLLAAGISGLLARYARRGAARRAAIEVSAEPLAEEPGATGSGLIAEGRALLAKDDLDEAGAIADSLLSSDSTSPHGYILQAQVSIRSRSYEEAADRLERAKQCRGGERAVARALSLVLVDIGTMLAKRRAPASLVNLAAETLGAADNEIVRTWTTDKRYWLRWGAVHIREAAGLPFDTVNVYVLDLKHGGSARTRRAAARKLGEIGDRRAIPALEEARDNGLADPFVSPTAATVLQEKFSK